MDSRSAAGLGKVSTRKTCSHHINVRQRREILDVIMELDARKLIQQDGLSWRCPFAEELRLEASTVQTQFKAANTSKKASY